MPPVAAPHCTCSAQLALCTLQGLAMPHWRQASTRNAPAASPGDLCTASCSQADAECTQHLSGVIAHFVQTACIRAEGEPPHFLGGPHCCIRNHLSEDGPCGQALPRL
jgi:hypothetical protein